jgi:thioredoxin-related protein
VAIALNLWGDRETVWLDGKARSEKELGAFLRVQFTPTLMFLDERGEVTLRVNGYQPPERFRMALAFAAQARPGGPGFAQFAADRAAAKASRAEPPAGIFLDQPPPLDRPGDGPALVFFDSRDCETCAELYATFTRPDIQALGRPFARHRVDLDDGFARSRGIAFAPSLLFLDAGRREVFRTEGYLRPYHVAAALDYVASGAYRTEPSFQRFIQARAERERAAGRTVELW